MCAKVICFGHLYADCMYKVFRMHQKEYVVKTCPSTFAFIFAHTTESSEKLYRAGKVKITYASKSRIDIHSKKMCKEARQIYERLPALKSDQLHGVRACNRKNTQ